MLCYYISDCAVASGFQCMMHSEIPQHAPLTLGKEMKMLQVLTSF